MNGHCGRAVRDPRAGEPALPFEDAAAGPENPENAGPTT